MKSAHKCNMLEHGQCSSKQIVSLRSHWDSSPSLVSNNDQWSIINDAGWSESTAGGPHTIRTYVKTSLRWPSLKACSIKRQSEAPCQRKEHQRPIERQMPALCTSPILEKLTWVLIVFVRSGQCFPSKKTCLMSLICLWISSTIANKVVIICSWASTQVDRHLPMSRTSRGYAYSVAGTKFSPCSQALGWDMRILSNHVETYFDIEFEATARDSHAYSSSVAGQLFAWST